MVADPATKCGRIYIGRPIGEAGKPCVLAFGHGGGYCRNAEGASWPKGAGEAVLVNPACRSACECHQNGGPCGGLDCDCPSYRIQQWGREIEASFAHRAALVAQRDAETNKQFEGAPLPDQRVTDANERHQGGSTCSQVHRQH